ncbi:MAG: RES domain-containing protein [Steroidobacteraceae bacterium]
MTSWPWAPDKLLMWRMDNKKFGASWDSGMGAEREGGRWNPHGYPAVYCSVDPSTAVLEVAVHKGFNALDLVPHVVTCAEIIEPGLMHVVKGADIPNANWLRPGTPGHAQQQFGRALLESHPFVAIQSAVCSHSWNIIFNPASARGKYNRVSQDGFALDTRLNPPSS